MIISGWKSRISCACFRSVRRTSGSRRAQTFRAVVRAEAAGKQAIAVGDVNFIFAEPPAARSERATILAQLSISFCVYPTTVGLPVVPEEGVNAHHLLHRHREGIEGIVVAQILFGGAGGGIFVDRLIPESRQGARRRRRICGDTSAHFRTHASASISGAGFAGLQFVTRCGFNRI